VLAVTEPFRGANDLVQHRLQSFGTRDCAINVADRPLLLAQVLVIPNKLVNVSHHALAHGADFTTCCPTPSTRGFPGEQNKSRVATSAMRRRAPTSLAEENAQTELLGRRRRTAARRYVEETPGRLISIPKRQKIRRSGPFEQRGGIWTHFADRLPYRLVEVRPLASARDLVTRAAGRPRPR